MGLHPAGPSATAVASLLLLALLSLLPLVPAGSVSCKGNLLKNGGAETVSGSGSQVTLRDWKDASACMVSLSYNAGGGYPGQTNSTAIKGGASFFQAGGSTSCSIFQDIDLRGCARRRPVWYANMSAWLGGWYNQEDYATVSATFYTADAKSRGSFAIGPMTAAQRNFITGFFFRSKVVLVPRDTAFVRFTLTEVRLEGGDNDGYADNLSLILQKRK